MKLSSTTYITLLLICFAVTISSCSDNSTNTTTNGSNGLPTGNLVGQIYALMDSVGNWQSDLSGVTVEAVGSGITAQSDSKGYWELKNLPTRTYDLKFSKPGYVDYYQTGYSFLGGASSMDNGTVYLIMQPRFTITFDGMTVALSKGQLQGSLFAHCSGNAPDITAHNICALAVFGSTPTIDVNDNSTYITLVNVGSTPTDVPSKSLTYLNWYVYDTTLFHSGQTVYCRLYPFLYTTSYVDIDHHQTIYQGQGIGSNVLSQILP
ncbi:MAG TPA: hypothetical protein VFO76_02475 [Candidatus Kapabacteria bacterium]|nr:hypothetical protein [Candidatus Kapabacteria bacterium]